MIEAYKKFWKGYDDFRGRSTPSDYWFAYSAHVLIFFASYLLLAVFQGMAVDETSLLRNEVIFLFIFFVYGVAATSYLSFLPMVWLRFYLVLL